MSEAFSTTMSTMLLPSGLLYLRASRTTIWVAFLSKSSLVSSSRISASSSCSRASA